MHPAFSVILLTTLIGAGQGLFLALFTGQLYASIKLIEPQGADFYALGSAVALALLLAGLGASFFHLGRPERAWRHGPRAEDDRAEPGPWRFFLTKSRRPVSLRRCRR
jgi:DMSO reductase anchor subunit